MCDVTKNCTYWIFFLILSMKKRGSLSKTQHRCCFSNVSITMNTTLIEYSIDFTVNIVNLHHIITSSHPIEKNTTKFCEILITKIQNN